MTTKVIKEFKGQHSFLSNFYPAKIIIDNLSFATLEHFYQASKTKNREQFETIRTKAKPGQAKYFGRRCELREDWEEIKIDIMKKALRAKFDQHPALKKKLIETQNAILEEGNSWGDKFWGIDLRTGEGLNMLGELLMELRELFQQNKEI